MSGVVDTSKVAALAPARTHTLGVVGRADEDASKLKQAIADSVANVLGKNVAIEQRGPFAMSMTTGFSRDGTGAHGTTGIPYAIAGTAKVVEIDVAERLTAFSDPIRAILGTSVHGEQKIIIKRQYVAGGGAQIVPERAPARTVAIQEDVREVVLTRYGADIEFNMNLLLKPQQFQREMAMKVNAQQESLQMELVKMAYDMVMTEGTSLLAALVASNPVGSATPQEAQATAERLYVSSVFGAMNRFPYPVHNLLAAAKHASASTIATAPKTVLIVPTGLPELHKYTKSENMVSYIHGVTHGDPLTAKVVGGQTDVAHGTTVFTHVPPVNNTHGAANAVAEPSLLANDVWFATIAEGNAGNSIYDHIRRERVPLTSGKVTIRIYHVSMQSAILGVPNGSNQATGEMLVGYPSTMVGNDVSTEVGRMKLRVYMGSVLYRPENVMILPDVAWNGIHAIYTLTDPQQGRTPLVPGKIDENGAKALLKEGWSSPSLGTAPGSIPDLTADMLENMTIYQAATFDKDGKQITHNLGHLGDLDAPGIGDRVFGVNVYSATPSAV